MSKKKNKTGKSKNVLAILKDLETKGDVKNSAIETGKSLVVGLIGAGVGAAFGKPSLAVGVLTAGLGHYYNSKLITTLGVGMIASGGYQIGSGVNGTAVGGMEGVKERVKAFTSNIKDRLYLDKIIKSKGTNGIDGTDGLDDVQYFKYPSNELNMGSLDDIENDIARSGAQFQRQMSGASDDLEGIEDKLY